MSTIAGIWYTDGRPLPETELGRLVTANRAPSAEDGRMVTPAPGLALHAQVTRFDRLSATEQQPYTFGKGSVLTWDGRLDNRTDLLVRLRPAQDDNVSDAALVAAAYQRWGAEALPLLVGDWSLALWDATTETLLLARDPLGNRALYYRYAGNCLAWATCVEALAAAFDLASQIDDAYIVSRLIGSRLPAGMTPFAGTRLLRAGHRVVASRQKGIVVGRHFNFQPATIRYRTRQDYTDRLRELLTEAVRVRLRASRPAWAHLSGGFDSSSVVCLGQTLVRHGRVETPRLQAVSMVLTEPHHASEGPIIRAVERWCGLSSLRLDKSSDQTFADVLRREAPDIDAHRYAPDAPVHAAGDHVVLTGALGDLIMLKTPLAWVSLLEPLHAGHPFKTLRLWYAHARHRGRPFHRALIGLARLAYSKPSRTDFAPSAILRAPGVHARLAACRAPRWTPPPESTAEFPILKRLLVTDVYQTADRLIQADPRLNLARTDPYGHRPLIEFVLAVPGLALWDPFVASSTTKSALADVLPPELLNHTKGAPSLAPPAPAARHWTTDLARERELIGPVADWQLVKRQYVEEPVLTAALEAAYAGTTRPSPFIVRGLTLEAWLRGLTSTTRVSSHPAHASLSFTANARV